MHVQVLALSNSGNTQDEGLDAEARRVMEAEMRMELTALKNAAYASGYQAAVGGMRLLLQ